MRHTRRGASTRCATLLGVFVLEGDAPLVAADQAAVRDGDAVGVAGEIGEHGLGPGGGRLGIDDPIGIVPWREVAREGVVLDQVRVLSKLFQRLFLEKLAAAHEAGRLHFFSDLAHLSEPDAFAAYLAPWHDRDWVVYAKKPFAGPETVLAYLSRYTHRVAISNSRLIALDERGVTFKHKDYRLKGRERHKTMTLKTHEFIHRFLLHVLPSRFHRIRHYGLLANGQRADNLALAR